MDIKDIIKKTQNKSSNESDEEVESKIKDIASGVRGTELLRIKLFELGEKYGIHIIPVHFYQPVPDIKNLNEEVYEHVKKNPEINFREQDQLSLINEFGKYSDELKLIPHDPTGKEAEFYFNNDLYGELDAIIYYSMIREFKPKKIIEVGSGFSTMLASNASLKNEDTSIISIEPYPNSTLTKGLPNLVELIKKPVQEIPISKFKELQENDILFIDSSHVVQVGSDVNYLFLEVIPELNSGVLIHVHDWFYPYEYPKSWIKDRKIFWNEMYLVQAFLIGNSNYEILTSNYFLITNYLDKLKESFPFMITSHSGAGSLWLRKK